MDLSSTWYELVEDNANIEQGDFIINCPVIIPPKKIVDNEEYETEVKEYNVIIMSQSCDLQQKKLRIVLVCPFYELEFVSNQKKLFKEAEMRESLRRGHLPGYHLLNKPLIDAFNDDYLVVSFRDVFGINYNFLKDFVNDNPQRLRLLSPYREHLSQAFARFFMRVGLPSDIPKFSDKTVLVD